MKHVNNYPDYYIHKDGKLWSNKTNKYLKPVVKSDGYLQYSLSKNGKIRQYYAHRLVAEHYLEQVKDKKEVNHIDGNKSNNDVSNLEWCTRSENMSYNFSNLGHKAQCGEDRWNSKLTEELVRYIRNSSETAVAIAKRYGVGEKIVRDARRGDTWKHV